MIPIGTQGRQRDKYADIGNNTPLIGIQNVMDELKYLFVHEWKQSNSDSVTDCEHCCSRTPSMFALAEKLKIKKSSFCSPEEVVHWKPCCVLLHEDVMTT